MQPYFQKTIKNGNHGSYGNQTKWNVRSIEKGQKIVYSSNSYHNSHKKPKLNSHRTLTVQEKEKDKLVKSKNTEKREQKTPKIRQQLSENKNYRF